MNTHPETNPINERQKVMKIKKFCCIHLRTCGLIIGYLELASALLFLGSFFGVFYTSKYETSVMDKDNEIYSAKQKLMNIIQLQLLSL